jgi:hypothetical protein
MVNKKTNIEQRMLIQEKDKETEKLIKIFVTSVKTASGP